jgi:hypothetical protein
VREKPLPSSKAEELLPRKPDAEDARIISLVVLDRPVFMVFSRTVTTDLQVIASIIGVPGLLVFVLSGWRERRKAAAEKRQDVAAHRAVKAPADLQNPVRSRRKWHPGWACRRVSALIAGLRKLHKCCILQQCWRSIHDRIFDK